MREMTLKQSLPFIILLSCILALTFILGTTSNVKASHGHEGTVEELLLLVDQLEADGELRNHGAAQSLKANEALLEEPYLEEFKDKLDQHVDKGRISAEGYAALEVIYELIIHQRDWLTIVREGQANAVIIIADDAESNVSVSAATLAEYVGKSTGAVLPVMTSSAYADVQESFVGHARIYVGQSVPGDEAAIESVLEGIDEQGFMIRPDGSNLTIMGPTA
jgi:hypothetical protein